MVPSKGFMGRERTLRRNRSLHFAVILRTGQNQRSVLDLVVWDFFGTWALVLGRRTGGPAFVKNERCIAPSSRLLLRD